MFTHRRVAHTLALAGALAALAAPAVPAAEIRDATAFHPAISPDARDTTFSAGRRGELARSPDSAAASTDAISTSGGALSAVWILLISVGGAMALAGVAYTTVRVVHAHGTGAS